MAKYIKLEAALRVTHIMRPEDEDLKSAISNIPAVDAAPVVHGRWAHLGGDEWCCSACGFVITTEGSWDKPTKKYCEDCGAMMDGGADHKAD